MEKNASRSKGIKRSIMSCHWWCKKTLIVRTHGALVVPTEERLPVAATAQQSTWLKLKEYGSLGAKKKDTRTYSWKGGNKLQMC
jgi:hypothetical protein